MLCGGLGTRLGPSTEVANKHLLPVYDRPMLFYPLEMLARLGVLDVLVVVGGNSIGELVALVGDGKRFGLSVNYAVQSAPGGIAHALRIAERFADGENVLVALGDNLFGPGEVDVSGFASGGRVYLKPVPDPERFGVPRFEDGRLVDIVEKPANPPCDMAVTGLYLYDGSVFERAARLVPSGRGELEITDVNNSYIRDGAMDFRMLSGWWCDAGTPESLYRAATLVRKDRESV